MSNDGSGNKLRELLAAKTEEKARAATRGVKMVPSQPQNSPLSALAQLLGRPVVQGLYYNGKVVQLDGYNFVGCRFDNCKLLVRSTNFEVSNCVIDPSTVIEYGAEPMKIMRLFNLRNERAYANTPAFAPRKNADGSISIDGAQQ
jgi:hypothetical protein